MTELLNDVDTPSDAELISRVRGGDVAAYGDLFSRHRDAANRLARQLVRGPDSDDLVSEAFAKVLTVLQGGGGPDVAFRAYLLTAVRRLHVDRIRSGQRLQTTDDLTPFDPGVPFQDTAVAGFESGAAAKAFASLPERWQLVLWHLEVEGQRPADIAPLLGMSANSVSALAYRAREGLRQAFLTMHLSDISDTDCRWVNEHLGAFVRKGLSKRDAGKVQSHLDGCRRCTAMHLELTDVNSNLAAIIAPLLLGAAATGYLASSGGATAVGVLSLVSRAKDFAAANTGGVMAGAVSIGVAAAAVVTIAVTQNPGNKPNVVADPPAGLTSSAPASPGSSPGATATAGAPRRPSTAATPSLTSSPTTTGSASPSASALSSATPSASAATDLPASPVTDGSTDVPTESSTDNPTGDPTGPATDVPSDSSPSDPLVAAPVIHADGTVTVAVQNLRATDILDVTMDSDETTFADAATGVTCQLVADRHVRCEPGAALLRGGRTAAFTGPVRDYTVTLPLDFPEYMVEDQLRVTASVDGAPTGQSVTETFHPSRTPAFDFRPPVVGETSTHTLDGDQDRYQLSAGALPPRVTVVYTLDGDARFTTADDNPCTVGDGGSSLTCRTVKDGPDAVLPIVATSLRQETDVQVSVDPVATFVDPTPGDRTSTLTLQPGADLGLDLSVVSANPDRSGSVQLTGTVSGVRPGLSELSYTIGDGARFADTGNAGCTTSGTTMTCPAPQNGELSLTVQATDRHTPSPVTISVAPGRPFVQVGRSGPRSVTVNLPGRQVNDYSLERLTETGHRLTGDADVYTLTGSVGALPTGAGSASFSLLAGGAFAADQTDPDCRLDTTPVSGGQVTCDGLTPGQLVDLTVESTTTSAHDATVRIEPTDPFDDIDPTNNTRTVTGLRPGTHLRLSPPDLGRVHQDDAGSYPVTTTVTGIRPGVDEISFRLGDRLSFDASGSQKCTVTDARLTCAGLVDGDAVSFTVRSDTPTRETPLTVVASPGGDFIDLYDDNTTAGALVPGYDFAMGDLVETAHTLSGNSDEYTLSSTVPALPADLDALTFVLTEGGTFASAQDTGCTRLADPTEVRCDRLFDGRVVDFHVSSTSVVEHPTRIGLRVPAGYDDPATGNDSGSTTVRPGVDLRLAALDPDNESPANDDDVHLVSTTLSGVRPGLAEVSYSLSGDASFVHVDEPGCTVAARTVTCQDPANGDLTFRVRADDVHATTPVAITARAAAPFVELDEGDNSDSVGLAARPTYGFAMGALSLVHQSLTGGTDHYTLRSTVSPVPDGVAGLTFAVTGGTFAADQATGCSRDDTAHVTCGDLGTARSVDFRVDSGTATRHSVVITLQPPKRYDDPSSADNSRSREVLPGVDLTMHALTPSDPLPSNGRYQVSSVLTGVRSGPVTFTLSGGASFVDSSCAVVSGSKVVCAAPDENRPVSFTLRPATPTVSTAVRITAAATSPFLELEDADNSAATTLSPDVSLDSLDHLGHRDSDHQVLVRAQVSGVPSGVSTVRVRLSGSSVGTGAKQVHLTGGVSGAGGEDAVTCRTTDAAGNLLTNGTYATCYHVDSASDGSFFIDMRVAHPHGTSTLVTFTVLPVGVDEGRHTANNSLGLTIS